MGAFITRFSKNLMSKSIMKSMYNFKIQALVCGVYDITAPLLGPLGLDRPPRANLGTYGPTDLE